MIHRSRFVGQTELPWDAGEGPAPTVYWKDVGPAVGRNLAAAPSELCGDHVLFQADLLKALTGCDFVALHWAEEAAPGPRPLRCELGCRLFAGELPDPFGRYVYACPGAGWPALQRRLDRLSFAATHGKDQTVWATSTYVWPVLDPILARRLTDGRPAPRDPPLMPVYLYGLVSPVGSYVWQPSRNHWNEPPRLVWTPPLSSPSALPNRRPRRP